MGNIIRVEKEEWYINLQEFLVSNSLMENVLDKYDIEPEEPINDVNIYDYLMDVYDCEEIEETINDFMSGTYLIIPDEEYTCVVKVSDEELRKHVSNSLDSYWRV